MTPYISHIQKPIALRKIALRLVLVFLFSTAFINGNSQTIPVTSGGSNIQGSRWYFGGNFGISFGTITNIYIAPVATYAFTEKLQGGLGVSYQYYSNRYYNPSYDISIYGGTIFARYFILKDLFAHIEYEKQYFRDSYNNSGNAPLSTIDGIYAGGGYRQWIGANSYMTIILLFDLRDNRIEFGINPFIRIGMGFGI